VKRAAAIIGSAIFLAIAPGTLAVYVPWFLTHWHFAPPLFPIARVLGAALIVAGMPILLDSFARFALQGLGTPAPVMPPKRLVVTGFYRYVRNPMYVAVTALIAGQGLLFGRHCAGVRRHRVGRILLVRCRLRRARAERAVCGRVQALSG
jgi:protein-S-isoprenylcysteine O-methyltransferase Ste14